MKTAVRPLKALLVWFVLLHSASFGTVQTTRTGHVTIPFEFWVGDTRLAAGDYQLKHVISPTLVVFTSKDSKIATEAYLLPLNTKPVKESEAKLVFLIQNGQHYLYEVSGVYGTRVMTAEYGLPKPRGDNRVEIQIVYR